jgi:hypothetical protein
MLAEAGYTSKPFAQAVKHKLGATVQITKRGELHTFSVMRKRWRWTFKRSFNYLRKTADWKIRERNVNTSLSI